MKIQIDQDYQIVSDETQYILQERKIIQESKDAKKVGEEYYANPKYFGTITAALKCYKELQIRKSDCTSIDEVISLIRDLDKRIDNLLKQDKLQGS